MPGAATRGRFAPIESVDIAPELEDNIMIADTLSSCANPSGAGAAVHSGAEKIHFDAARVRHTSR